MSKPSDVRFEVARTEVMSRCLRCGAMVGDERRHREWHNGLSELIKAIEIMITFGG
jgi:hypothetical protein